MLRFNLKNILLYLIVLFLVITIYVVYHLLKKDLFKDKIKTVKNLVLLVTGVSYLFITLTDMGWLRYNFRRNDAIILIISISLLIYSYGLIENKKEIYQKNINYYLILYLVLLISITMFLSRYGIYLRFDGFFNDLKFYFNNYEPFAHITKYYLITNLIMLMPFSLLLMLKDDRYRKIYVQAIIIFITTSSIEILQLLTNAGAFDIDDIILNFSGALLFSIVMIIFKIPKYLNKLFYQDFNLKNNIKYLIFTIALIIPILFVLSTIKRSISLIFINL